MTSIRPLSQWEISRFFFPLLLNVQLMSVSHSIINGALARLSQPVLALAGFSIAMALHLFLASPSYQNHIITIALVRGRRSLIAMSLYVFGMAGIVSVLLILIAFTPAGPLVLQDWMGASPEIATEARKVIAILTLLPLFTGLRGLFQGLVIKARRTSLVSLATLLRIIALFGFLLLGRRWFSGAEVGAFSLLACIVVETVVMGWFAWRTGLPGGDETEKSLKEIVLYGLPLSFSSVMQQTVPLLISSIIARLPDSAMALAAFGIIRGFIFMLAGPMRNLQQAYLALVRNRQDYQKLIIFSRRVAIGMALIMVAVAYPLNNAVLNGLMGLTEDLRLYIAAPLAGCALYPVFYGAVNLLRGYYAAENRTGQLGWATVCKVGFLITCWLLVSFSPVAPPGIALAVFLLLSCELCEAWYLRRKRFAPP